jgi:hypothetical protein
LGECIAAGAVSFFITMINLFFPNTPCTEK